MTGKLLVVTGFSGAGKDTVIDTLIEKRSSFRRLITCADRDPRPGEVHGVHYYFVTREEMDKMHIRGELVEKPLLYGTSRKATPKKEFKKIISEGASLIWRIESSLASHVASGKFFDEQFTKEESAILKESTIVTFITASDKDLVLRRKKRDKEKYNPKEFSKRDEQDRLILKKHGHHFHHILENKEGQIEKTVEEIIRILEK